MSDPDNQGPVMAWTRLILDFLAKAFYPVIIIAVLIALAPSLAAIDMPQLVKRLQSASIGSTQLTFNQAEDVAITIAPLNSEISDLKRTIADLRAKVDRLQAPVDVPVLVGTAPPEPVVEVSPGNSFEQNRAYTVLIFHNANSRARAREITDRLLAAGYVASSTETDFSELSTQLPPGGIKLIHNQAGGEVYEWIAGMLGDTYPTAKLVAPEAASELRRGEVQILLF